MTEDGTGPSAPPDERPPWLAVIDMQRVFADPGSEWLAPRFAEIISPVRALADAFRPQVTFTRFIAPEIPEGAWRRYYEQWPFALQPPGAPIYQLADQFAGEPGPTLDRDTFSKWTPELWSMVGAGGRLLLAGVSTDCRAPGDASEDEGPEIGVAEALRDGVADRRPVSLGARGVGPGDGVRRHGAESAHGFPAPLFGYRAPARGGSGFAAEIARTGALPPRGAALPDRGIENEPGAERGGPQLAGFGPFQRLAAFQAERLAISVLGPAVRLQVRGDRAQRPAAQVADHLRIIGDHDLADRRVTGSAVRQCPDDRPHSAAGRPACPGPAGGSPRRCKADQFGGHHRPPGAN
jgi:hypothetical protein